MSPSILVIKWKKIFICLSMYIGFMYINIYICMFICEITFSGSEECFSWPVIVYIIIAVEKLPKNVTSHPLWQCTVLPRLLCWHFAMQFACNSRTGRSVLLALEYSLPFPWRMVCNGCSIGGYFSEVIQLKTHKEIRKFTYRIKKQVLQVIWNSRDSFSRLSSFLSTTKEHMFN